MPVPDFIYAGTPQEYERYLQHRPERRGVPMLTGPEPLQFKKGAKVLPIGEFTDRWDYDAVCLAIVQTKGEWLVP